MLKIINYKKDTLDKIEKVYKGYDDNKEIKELISKEHKSIILPMLISIALIVSYCISLEIKNIFSIILSVILAVSSFIFWHSYLKKENKKKYVINRVFDKIENTEILSIDELGLLQELIPEGEMVSLLWGNDREVYMKRVRVLLEPHTIPFKTYKAEQNYRYIQMVRESKKI